VEEGKSRQGRLQRLNASKHELTNALSATPEWKECLTYAKWPWWAEMVIEVV
jgi:hypothetical protein